MESWCLEMIKECLVSSSMRLGVPFIALRQLGAVGSNLGRQFLPSVGWRTGQALFIVRCGLPSKNRIVDRCRNGAVGALDTVRCTPDSPVPLPTVGAPTRHARIARPTVGAVDCWLTGQSGEF
jgi:hypothetical protein